MEKYYSQKQLLHPLLEEKCLKIAKIVITAIFVTSSDILQVTSEQILMVKQLILIHE